MSRDLPPRLRGSHCHLNAPTVVAPTGTVVQVTAPVGALATVDRPLAGGQAMADHLCKGSGHFQPPYFLAVFIAKM
ncbi:hypothetical protein B296_00034528 [Ensete ventricosum]|uniref:Uncharacterized protein n=1 Tax=Ensete ventricosum TaxID=4639 RepID=A0A426YS16_ENSVE|nr:hypothetical protein B296_00034528 [Ensete ventricosum]